MSLTQKIVDTPVVWSPSQDQETESSDQAETQPRLHCLASTDSLLSSPPTDNSPSKILFVENRVLYVYGLSYCHICKQNVDLCHFIT